MRLSVVMPVYNERSTLREVVSKVLSLPLELEIICVDDGSEDGSRDILARLQHDNPQVRVFLQPHNMGKAPLCAVASRKPAATLSSSKTPTWNTILRNTRCSWNL